MNSLFARKRLPRSGAPHHVVLIHGIWDTFRKMAKMERALRGAGFEPLVITLAPNGGQAALDTLGEQVHRQIEHRVPQKARFSIVGFSMGGLVARSYMRQFGDPERIATFVSLAAPNQGTWVAWLDNKTGVRDMRPGSAFLSSIDADATRFSKTRWITIRTPFDLLILPSTSTMLPWAKNFSFPVLAHPLLVTNPRVLDCIIHALDADPIST